MIPMAPSRAPSSSKVLENPLVLKVSFWRLWPWFYDSRQLFTFSDITLQSLCSILPKISIWLNSFFPSTLNCSFTWLRLFAFVIILPTPPLPSLFVPHLLICWFSFKQPTLGSPELQQIVPIIFSLKTQARILAPNPNPRLLPLPARLVALPPQPPSPVPQPWPVHKLHFPLFNKSNIEKPRKQKG